MKKKDKKKTLLVDKSCCETENDAPAEPKGTGEKPNAPERNNFCSHEPRGVLQAELDLKQPGMWKNQPTVKSKSPELIVDFLAEVAELQHN